MAKIKRQIRAEAQTDGAETLRGMLKLYAAKRGKTTEDMAARLNMSAQTYRQRLKSPQLFTLLELRALVEFLRIPEEDQYALIGGTLAIRPPKEKNGADHLAAALDRLTAFLAEKEKEPGEVTASHGQGKTPQSQYSTKSVFCQEAE